MKQKIIITALPNGVAMGIAGRGAKILKASAAISLQVEETDKSNTRLSDVKDMLAFAELIKNAKFNVEINGAVVNAKVTSTAIDTKLWKDLFSPNVQVKAFVQEPLHLMPIVSYPVKHIVDFIKGVVEQTGKKYTTALPETPFYTENPIFKSVADYVAIDQIPGKGRKEVTLDDMVASTNRAGRFKEELQKNKFIAFNQQIDPPKDFGQLKNFHGIYNKKNKPFAPKINKPEFEFHDILSILANYPPLLRKLGLVVDIEFAVPEEARLGTETPSIRIIPSAINFTAATTIVCPATAYTRTSNGFYAKPETGSPIDKGYVKINTDAFTVFQVDTDGGALKLCQQQDALQLAKAKDIFYAAQNNLTNTSAIPLLTNRFDKREGLPSQRTAGIAIARNGMAEKLNARFNRMNDLKTKMQTGNAAPLGISGNNANWVLPIELLTADDINIGFRMDVQVEDKTGTWYSLHKRTNKYGIVNAAGNAIAIPDMEADEGYLQTSATEENTDAGKQLKVSEAIARWEGWSLSVPRPGSTLNEPLLDDANEVYKSDSQQEKDKYKTPPTADFKLNVIPSIVKGSLPMLRFGKKYGIKLRTVDLAGNSVAVNTAPENGAECIKTGVRYMRYEPVDAPFLIMGNTIKDGESAEVMVIRSNEGQTTAQYEAANPFNGNTYAAEAVRHVKPPRTTVEMATLHGMLDAGMGQANSALATKIYNDITPKKDPAVSNTADMHIMKVVSANETTLDVEYLIDPMAIGVSFFLSPNDPNPKLANPSTLDRWISFYFDPAMQGATLDTPPKPTYEQWMAPKTFRIKLLEAATPSLDWDSSTRTLKVSLQKGFMLKLGYACFWKPSELIKNAGVLDMMGMNNLNGPIGEAIAKGKHWLFSPWRELTFVHAVQQPVQQLGAVHFPAIASIQADRNYTDNYATINTKLLVHGPSTAQLDVEAKWKEPIDDILTEITPAIIASTNQINIPFVSKVQQFTTQYAVFEYMFGNIDQVKNNPFPGLKHLFNDTKHRKVIYNAIASTRYKENFYNLINEKQKNNQPFSLTRTSPDSVVVTVPSSARPAAPEVAYVIPTFEWDRDTKGAITLTGRASGLRVYLKRPWFSSGEGEKLAVVLHVPSLPQLGNSPGSAGVPVTVWGTDPTKKSSPLPVSNTPTADMFLKGEKVNELLTPLENEANGKVAAVAYEVSLVKFDVERQLYFVDIMLNSGAAYFPFIKLALARYQKESVKKEGKDCCLSPIVVTEYIQIPPPRATSLEIKGAKNNIVVAISGSAPRPGNAKGIFMTKVEFLIESITLPASDSVHISTGQKPIETYSYLIQETDFNSVGFYHSHAFNLPAEYANKPYRISIKEYEILELDKEKPNPNPAGQSFGGPKLGERLVFADVYEINK
ncbi:MAG: hypothetical protein RIR12_570 [Bacteroidota bacterium]|jgi:hypothetical protein